MRIKIAPHGAADAAVVHLKQFLLALDHELVVDPDLTELVFDHRELFPVLLGQNAIEQSGFARAEEAGEDGDRDRSIVSIATANERDQAVHVKGWEEVAARGASARRI